MNSQPRHVAIVLKGYPRLSETFVSQELLSLQQLGLEFTIYSLRHPTDKKRHALNEKITRPVVYLPEYLHQEPLRVFRAWLAARRLSGYKSTRSAFFADLRRDFSRNRFRRFGQGMVLAGEMPGEIDWIYVHFLHTPASAARYGARLRGLPWSVSAHAKDIYTSADWEIRDKLSELEWLATCTAANVAHLRQLAGEHADKVRLVYHGLDFARFPDTRTERPPRDGSRADDPVVILSVGRAVPKKGYDVLLQALARLPRDLSWSFVHIGGGAELAKLKQLAVRLGIEQHIEWRGAEAQAAVIEAYRTADLFVLASRIAGDGDRDGLPNVLMEAQSQGLACVSTAVSAIPELISDGETGLLVPPGETGEMAAALAKMIAQPGLRQRLGLAGAEKVRASFAHHKGMQQLADLFSLRAEQDNRDEGARNEVMDDKGRDANSLLHSA